MKIRRIYFIILSVVIFPWQSMGQNMHIVDSLERIITETKVDSVKGKALNELFLEYEFVDPIKAGDFLNKSFSVYSKIKHTKGLAETYQYLGYLSEDQGNYLEAIKNYNSSLAHWKKIENRKGIAVSFNNLGNAFYSLGNYSEALKNYFSSLKIRENIGDKDGIAASYINIGLVYYNQGNYEDAVKHYNSCLTLYKTIGNKPWIAKCYSYLGLVYHKQGKMEDAIKNHMESLTMREEYGDIKGIAECYNNLGGVYSSQGNHTEALKSYFASLEIKERIGDRKGIATTFGNIGIAYIHTKNFNESEKYLKKSLALLHEIGAKESIKGCYHALSKLDSTRCNYSGAYKYYKLFIQYRDSIDNEEIRKKTIQSQMTYEFEKKEAVATAEHKMELENQDAIANEKSRKQKLVILFVITGLVLVIIFAFFIFRSLRITRKQKKTIENQKQIVEDKNLQLNQQNEEIRTQRDEIEAQRDEIEAQRDLVTIQKEEIEEVHNEVKASINYAKRIQEAVLPVSENSRSILGEHFILFKPKDIVSGDFYWTTKINNWIIIAVADCTGHGVPGAFMSMLGISFLNEIVQKKEIHKASQILNILRQEIINALQQKGVQGEQKDGMDISLLVINKDTNECQWAGANNPLYVIARKPLLTKQSMEEIASLSVRNDEAEMYELKGDKMPIAIYPEMKDFTNHEFVLQKGDSVYLFTDGYADQFGGPKGRKFMYKRFKETLLRNVHFPMNEQKMIFEYEFNNWLNGNEQIDDVTVFGVRF